MLKTFLAAFVAVAFLTSATFAGDTAAAMSRGDALFKAAQYRQALLSYQRVVQLEPGNARAYHQIGESYDKLGMPSQAAEAWEKEVGVLLQGGPASRPAQVARNKPVYRIGRPVAPGAGRYTTCIVGDRVADSDGNRGTVTYVNADGSCGFKYDNSGMTNTYPAAQLHRVGRAVAAAAGFAFVPPGQYECYAGENYTFTDIIIVGRSNYRDNKGHPGVYSFDPGSQVITFKSGTFKDNYAKYMARGRIGLAAKPEIRPIFFDELCEAKH